MGGAATPASGKLISWDGKLHTAPLVADLNVQPCAKITREGTIETLEKYCF